MFYTGLDPFTGQEVHVARHLRDRKLQRALLQFFKPDNYFEVRKALMEAGRQELIGSGCDCLIPAQPPKAALQSRMARAQRDLGEGKYVHTIPKAAAAPAPAGSPPTDPARRERAGYRPHRKTARRKPR